MWVLREKGTKDGSNESNCKDRTAINRHGERHGQNRRGTRGVLDVFGLRCLFNFHIDLLSISRIQESGVLMSV